MSTYIIPRYSGATKLGRVVGRSYNPIRMVETGNPRNPPPPPTPHYIPNVVGMLLPDAQAAILAAGFVLGLATFDFSSRPVNSVIAQNPLGGLNEPLGTIVYLAVSQGVMPQVVPYLTGLSADDANSEITARNFTIGLVRSVPSAKVALGEVITQSPRPFTVAASGSLVNYVLSSGIPPVLNTFDFEATVISQFQNSPTILQLVQNMDTYIDQRTNFAEFFALIWNVDTATGFGLDIWGKIVNVSRLLEIPNSNETFGFQDGAAIPDVTPFNVAPFNNQANGVLTSYYLADDAYRTLVLAKALANISSCSAPALNQLLSNLFAGRGEAYVVDLGGMAMQFQFKFALTVTEYAILTQSGALPHPAGVSVSIVVP